MAGWLHRLNTANEKETHKNENEYIGPRVCVSIRIIPLFQYDNKVFENGKIAVGVRENGMLLVVWKCYYENFA